MCRGQAAAEPFGVLPENWPALELFLALGTQWRFAGMDGVRVGLDYAAVEPTMRLLGLEPSKALFADLRVMEQEALQALREKRR